MFTRRRCQGARLAVIRLWTLDIVADLDQEGALSESSPIDHALEDARGAVTGPWPAPPDLLS